MKKEVDVVIICGGRGQKMGELTAQRQKCLLPIDGKPILTHILDNIITALGSAHVILATGYRGEDVRSFCGDNYGNLNISYVHDPKIIESRRRLLLAKDYLHSSFLFLSGNVICHPERLAKVVELHESAKSFVYGTVAGASQHEPALNHALLTVKGSRIIRVTWPPTPTWAPDQLRDMNVACYSPEFLRDLENAPNNILYIHRVVSTCIEKGKYFQASPYLKKWYHLVEPADLNTVITQNYD